MTRRLAVTVAMVHNSSEGLAVVKALLLPVASKATLPCYVPALAVRELTRIKKQLMTYLIIEHSLRLQIIAVPEGVSACSTA